MKKTKLSNLLLITLLVTGCVGNIPPVIDNKPVNQGVGESSNSAYIKLTADDIALFDKEYAAFSNLALISAYYQSNLAKLISYDNGVSNEIKIIQELEYARYKGESFIPFKSIFASNPSFYLTIIRLASVINQRSNNPSFDTFIQNSDPTSSIKPVTSPTVVTALSASAINATGFTANWVKSDDATLGYLLTVKKGDTIINTISIDSKFTTSQVITGLTASTGYSYIIQGKNSSGLRIGSNYIYVYTTSAVSIPNPVMTSISSSPDSVMVSTLAGDVSVYNPDYKYRDGAGTNARFDSPAGIGIDSKTNNLYIVEYGGNRIRKVTSDGVVSILAGSGRAVSGFENGVGTDARFNGPNGIAVDSNRGNLYVTDGNRIRKVTFDGIVSDFAGSTLNDSGYLDATGTNAKFNNPKAITIDSKGTIYVSEYTGNRIRKITPDGVVTTIAGSTDSTPGTRTGVDSRINNAAGYIDATGTDAKFTGPSGIAVDPNTDNLYVVEEYGNRIRKITPTGVVTTFAGSTSDNTYTSGGYVDATGTNARFTLPVGIAVDSKSNIYVTEYGRNKLRKITSSGVVTTLAGNSPDGYADGIGTDAKFYYPSGIVVDSNGVIYLTEGGNRIRKIK